MPFLEFLDVFNAVSAKSYIAPLPRRQLHFKLNLKRKTVVSKSAWVKPCYNKQKSQFSISFMNWEKLRNPTSATFKNSNLFIHYLLPNLSFTVENKDGNLHKVRLDTFQTKYHEWDIQTPWNLNICQWR